MVDMTATGRADDKAFLVPDLARMSVRLRIKLDRKLGRETPEALRKIAFAREITEEDRRKALEALDDSMIPLDDSTI